MRLRCRYVYLADRDIKRSMSSLEKDKKTAADFQSWVSSSTVASSASCSIWAPRAGDSPCWQCRSWLHNRASAGRWTPWERGCSLCLRSIILCSRTPRAFGTSAASMWSSCGHSLEPESNQKNAELKMIWMTELCEMLSKIDFLLQILLDFRNVMTEIMVI